MSRMTWTMTLRVAGKGRSSLVAATVLTLCFSTLISTSPAQGVQNVTSQELVAPAGVQVFRNGTVVGGCTSPTEAVPDPCVVSRGFAASGAGDAQVTVRTSQFSIWNVGKLSYTLKAGLEPVNLPPVVNTTKAGGAVPVRFKLGGNRGLDVFATGFPKSSVMTCSGGSKDEVELTLPLAKSSLVYERLTQQYIYLWKTDKTWRGCRDLVLTFRDGSSTTAHFVFR